MYFTKQDIHIASDHEGRSVSPSVREVQVNAIVWHLCSPAGKADATNTGSL